MRIQFYDPENQNPTYTEGFTLNWIAQLRWNNNPFQTKTIHALETEQHDINVFFIKEHRFGTISGKQGMGKTTLLKWIQTQLPPTHKTQYIDYENLDSHLLRQEIADNYKGLFSRGEVDANEELIERIHKKIGREKHVLLIDNAEEIDTQTAELITELNERTPLIILLAGSKIPTKKLPKDTLKLTIKKRTIQQYTQLLTQKIQEVGGVGIQPFSEEDIQTIAQETDNTQDFLLLAQETAIHHAVTPKLTQKTEQRKQTTSGVQGKKKTKYDELIESLGEEIGK